MGKKIQTIRKTHLEPQLNLHVKICLLTIILRGDIRRTNLKNKGKLDKKHFIKTVKGRNRDEKANHQTDKPRTLTKCIRQI